MTEHTPTPWEYRPHRLDDWGWIRGPLLDGQDIAPLVAMARSGTWESVSMLDEHRANKTDPYAANAAFIVKAVNNHAALLTFFQWAMQEGPWEGGNLDGGTVQDKAESLGLIVSVPYDPDKHGAYNDCGCDAGDPWFEFAPGLCRAVGQQPERGK